jgi:hypothetical protein
MGVSVKMRASADRWRTQLGVVLAIVALCGSSCVSLESGSLPRTDRLSQLQVGVSTKADVRRILGKPRGRGAFRLTPELGQGEIWAYDYFKGSPKLNMKVDLEHSMLMVLFTTPLSDPDGRLGIQAGRYFGHFWVSTLDPADLGTAEASR